MPELCLDIFLRYLIAHIERTLAGACITLSADIFSGLFLLLILIQSLCGADCQLSVFQGNLHFIFGASRKIHFQSVFMIQFLNIGLHDIISTSAIQLFLGFLHITVIKEREIKICGGL